ncbi:hypothetical protein A8B83_07225 [Rhodobacteraceae bacterium EhC02]|jgi:hypothetical protein|nr:hypothetical protein A8B83_07225 [Rhodobacteraceae bacterium EhC02]
MAMRLSLLALGAAVALTGCSTVSGISDRLTGRNKQLFDGQVFRASVAFDKAAPADFVVRVQQPGKSLAGAREAGRFEATKHCITYFGNSTTIWQVGPDSPDAALVFDDDALVLTGRCAA